MRFHLLNRAWLTIGVVLVLVAGPAPAIAQAPAGQMAERGASSSRRGGFRNPGVYSRVVNQMLYKWIPTQDVQFDVLANGKVRIIAPETKRSFNGANDCRRFIYDHVHKRLAPAEEQALSVLA